MTDSKQQYLAEMLTAAEMITSEQVQKLEKKGKSENKIASAQDRLSCLEVLALDHTSVDQLLITINKLFSDFDDDGKPVQAIVLGTVHRTKGLEGYRVYVLEPAKIPHPMAKKEWEREQELNLAYVACTRSKWGEVTETGIGFTGNKKTYSGELIFVGGECPRCYGKLHHHR